MEKCIFSAILVSNLELESKVHVQVLSLNLIVAHESWYILTTSISCNSLSFVHIVANYNANY